jgi:hypothetical protein
MLLDDVGSDQPGGPHHRRSQFCRHAYHVRRRGLLRDLADPFSLRRVDDLHLERPVHVESLGLARDHTHILLPDGNGVMLAGTYSRRVVVRGDKNEVETLRMDDILFVRQ